jgi:hypothetical protein
MSEVDRTIDRLTAELRVLDRQNAWLEAMIENWDHLNIHTPRTRGRGIDAMLDAVDSSVRMMSSESDTEEEDQCIDDSSEEEEVSGYESDTSNPETVVYHTEAWGFHPRGVDRGSYWWDTDSDGGSDEDTVVESWSDSYSTPMKFGRWTEEQAEHFFIESPGF